MSAAKTNAQLKVAGAKWMMDPRNEFSVTAAEAGYQVNDKLLSEMSGESAAFATSAILGGGIGLAAINKMTGGAISSGFRKVAGLEDSSSSKLSENSYTNGDGEQHNNQKNHTSNHKDSLKSYTNAEAHNKSIIPENKTG